MSNYARPNTGALGPQELKWRSMFYDTASNNNQDSRKKAFQMKQKLDSYVSDPQRNPPPQHFEAQDRELKRQNEFLQTYSKSSHFNNFRKGTPLFKYF